MRLGGRYAPPSMIVIAGPPGSGKSSAFPVQAKSIDYFNVDTRAAQLNGGSFIDIPTEIREAATRELVDFIVNHIKQQNSFAFETTLRTPITFAQAEEARKQGFLTQMIFVTLNSPEECIKRVQMRAQAGGQPTSPIIVRRTYKSSINNLGRAIRLFNRVDVFDNSEFKRAPRHLLKARNGQVYSENYDLPPWVLQAVRVSYEHLSYTRSRAAD